MNLTAETYLNLIRGGAARLCVRREEINGLNVFPIPDGDTGDNMYMTIEAGCNASGASLSEMAASASQGMLLSARGNSGVILSRIFAGLAKGLAGVDQADADVFHRALKSAVEEAYHAVAQPVEGTILTVLREGVEAAAGAGSIPELFDRGISGMESSLARTPELLAVLRHAGVVDSGGAGLLCIAEGMRDALGSSHKLTWEASAPSPASPAKIDFDAFTEDSTLEFGYCTEFLLRLQRSKVDPDHFDESVISSWLAGRGDSLVFFREGSIVKVHIHTDDPGAILSKCRTWGEFLSVKVENMTLQHHENQMDERFKRSRKALGIVTVASGKGLGDAFREMGADVVIPGGQTMNPPVEDFLKAFDETNAGLIVVFPNNANIILTARQAAGLYKDARVEVIPTRTLGEGYFAMAGLDASLPAEELVPALTEAAASVTTGMVSRAVKDSPDAREGEYIGFSGKDILTAGPSRCETVLSLAEKLDAGGADILMLIAGEDAPGEEAGELRSLLEKLYPRTELILLRGGQPIYDYILVTC